MMRLLPHPFLSLGLVLIWLLLTRFSSGHLLLGCVIGMLAGLVFARLEQEPPRIRAFCPLVRLAGLVSLDILRSNYAVARLMLTNGRHGARRSAFVEVPLRLRSPVALALLAIIVTATPGTAWLEYDARSGMLLLHVFDMVDEEEWRLLVQGRYEALLLEAFE
jgi:multicomponent K+:H+ antiporter subunit E